MVDGGGDDNGSVAVVAVGNDTIELTNGNINKVVVAIEKLRLSIEHGIADEEMEDASSDCVVGKNNLWRAGC